MHKQFNDSSMKIKNYNYNNVNSLKHIDDKYISEVVNDQIIQEIGEILVTTGLSKKVGVALLHNHYKLKVDEAIVKFYNNEEITTSVHSLSNLPVNKSGLVYAPTIMKLESDGILPLELGLVSKDLILSGTDYDVLSKVFELLSSKGLDSVFGIALRLPVFNKLPNKNESYLENTFNDRSQISKIVKNSKLGNAIPTTWIFDGKGSEIVMYCPTHCNKLANGDHAGPYHGE